MSWSDELPQYMQKCIVIAPTHDEPAILELITRSRAGNAKATDELVRQFMEYALSIANTMEHNYSYRVAAEDFLQAALVGLLETIRSRFDLSRKGAKFTTVAWFWMRKNCFELVAELGYPVKRPRNHLPIGAISFDAPGAPDTQKLFNVVAPERLDPETAVAVTNSWSTLLLVLIEAINALDDMRRTAVISRNLTDSDLTSLLHPPEIKPHRTTLWRNERQALHKIHGWISRAIPEHDVLDTLQLIDISRHLGNFDDSFEAAYAP